ncbi:MAG: hypothetical protein GC164_16145 [Phycisphaera sp.]|nr:hypothetical protein [Phycisphaera sp.]
MTINVFHTRYAPSNTGSMSEQEESAMSFETVTTHPALEQLNLLWGQIENRDLRVVLNYKRGDARGLSSEFFRLDEVEDFVARAEELDGYEVWFRVTPMHTQPESGRGKVDDTAVMPALYIDLDVGKPGSPTDAQAARKLLEELVPLPPSMVVGSGHGLHAYWVLKDPVTDLEHAKHIAEGWKGYVQRRAETEGYKLDSVFDLARILRLAGTRNYKSEPPVPVTLEEHHTDRLHTTEALKSLWEASPATAVATSTATPATRSSNDACDKVKRCVGSMVAMRIEDHYDGSKRLYAAACRAVEHDLDDELALKAIREYEKTKPFPKLWTDDEVLARIRDAEKITTRGLPEVVGDADDPRPVILLTTEEHEVIDQAVNALAQDEALYRRGGVLVRVIHTDECLVSTDPRTTGKGVVVPIAEETLSEHLTRHALLCHPHKYVTKHPPTWLTKGVLARGEWPGIRPLNGISTAPLLRSDGTVADTSGYDRGTGMLLEIPTDLPSIPEHPTHAQARASAARLLSLVEDFYFEDDVHKAAFLAALLTPLARCAFTGPAPLFLIDANVRGAGKSLLAQVIGHIVLGRPLPASGYAHDSEEMRKKITTLAMSGASMVLLDNVVGRFGNDALDRAMTSDEWSDRLLGQNRQVTVPLGIAWYATGNNIAVGADMGRRCLYIRLDAPEERPELRTGFQHPDLMAYVIEHRGELLVHALTVLRAYCAAGKPCQTLPSFGSFEGWSALVRQAVVWLGYKDPCETTGHLIANSDNDAADLGEFFEALKAYDPHNDGVIINNLVGVLYPNKHGISMPNPFNRPLRAALESLTNTKPGTAPTARQVGALFKRIRGRNVGGYRLVQDETIKNRLGATWRLEEVKSRTNPAADAA